ncbi:nitrous oxide reductase accessory protein NosL [Bacillus massiliigorillae]|uniref:nitrous oxide reductase accessory protein NosL n=1 Tax=Bacillus massiliigorillae TaxID=1243664 RepID=UPI0003A206A2|nr:nitrous oxide reductase accessory protein NosL [Bacillus massiliigorillae]
MKKLSSLLIVVFLLAACGKEQSFEPAKINPEVDVCEICNMSIAEENFATQLFSKDGDVYKFDDIGCMYEFIYKDKRIAEKDIAKQYVRDMESGKWLEAKEAHYAYNKGFWTPMAYGVVVFEKQADAEKYLKEQGKGELYDFKQLSQHKWGWEK